MLCQLKGVVRSQDLGANTLGDVGVLMPGLGGREDLVKVLQLLRGHLQAESRNFV